jgi:quercetin dioxygenase-like cupin family protein
MIVKNAHDFKDQKIDSYPYKGKPYKVKDTYIRWLSQAGPEGAPEYGLRYFRVGPAGEIPLHNHLYYQTMYILTGRIAVMQHDPKTDQVVQEKAMGPNDFVFIPTMEPHSMRNLSDQEDCTFLCCIANVYEEGMEGI